MALREDLGNPFNQKNDCDNSETKAKQNSLTRAFPCELEVLKMFRSRYLFLDVRSLVEQVASSPSQDVLTMSKVLQLSPV